MSGGPDDSFDIFDLFMVCLILLVCFIIAMVLVSVGVWLVGAI